VAAHAAATVATGLRGAGLCRVLLRLLLPEIAAGDAIAVRHAVAATGLGVILRDGLVVALIAAAIAVMAIALIVVLVIVPAVATVMVAVLATIPVIAVAVFAAIAAAITITAAVTAAIAIGLGIDAGAVIVRLVIAATAIIGAGSRVGGAAAQQGQRRAECQSRPFHVRLHAGGFPACAASQGRAEPDMNEM
jgi:hypothetical protein